ncbi:MAG: sugar transporter [Gammaproteobacteria bacterium]|nr:MAG: sugar transporter [Gammaproteobacteria bacterium]
MEDEYVKGLGDYLDILRRRKYFVIIPAVILIIISTVVAYTLPATYKSEGLILIESQEIPTNLVRSTVTSYADQRIEVIKQRLMTTGKVMAVVNKYSLYPDMVKQSQPISSIVATFRGNVKVEMVSANVTDPNSGRSRRASIAFTVSFMDKSPVLAQKVANDLVTVFLNENVRTRTEKATETKKFLEEEANKFQRKVQLIEKKIAEFKDEYSDSLPELLQYNLARVEQLQKEHGGTQNQIIALNDQIMTMNLELVHVPAYLDNQQGTPQAYQTQEQATLAKLKTELAEITEHLMQIKQRYSANHPDVKSVTKQLKLLEDKVAASESKGVRLSPNKLGNRMNPAYLQIKSRIDSSEREIVRLRNGLADVKSKLTVYEQRIVQTHQVQRAYDDLTRDHVSNLRKYEELRAKELEAGLAENLESENKGEKFSLIDPPLVPNKAEKPNRAKIVVMGVVMSVGIGVGLALAMELLLGGIRGYKQISRVLGSAPLVVIPVITTVQDIQLKAANRKRILFILLLLMGLSVVGFHFLIMDLEVLWFKVIRKISLL